MSEKRRQALGRGLAALLGPKESETPGTSSQVDSHVGEGVQDHKPQSSLIHVSVAEVQANPNQPRQDFDSESLKELADSIRATGLIQPLVVRRVKSNCQLIAGERRLRAAKLAGLTEVPCIVTDVTDEQSLVLALVENLQREDLNAIDEAEAYAHLREDFGLSQEDVAERVGRSRVSVANSLRLLKLPQEIQEDVRDGAISAGHARALLGIPDAARQRAVWSEVKQHYLSVRETEERCREEGAARPRQTSAFTGRPPRRAQDPQTTRLTEELMARLGCKVTIHATNSKRGRVALHYASTEEFERIMDVLGLPAASRL